MNRAVAIELTTRSREGTEEVGERIGRAARPGDVVALWGELGAGKTTLVRGIAHGLGIGEREVTSPSFVIVHEHDGGRLPLFHIDLYRIAPEDAASTGWDEELTRGGVAAIEWPDRVEGSLPADRLDVRIEHVLAAKPPSLSVASRALSRTGAPAPGAPTPGAPPPSTPGDDERRLRLEPTGPRSAALAQEVA